MSQSPPAADQARAELYEVMQQDLPFEEKAARALGLGRAYLGVQNSHLTQIDERIDFWEAIASTDPPDGDFPAGEVLDLQTTYCRRVIERGSSIALSDAPNQGWADDPAFEEHGLHCYHGTPLSVEGEVFGTVCFVSEDPRDEPFSERETLFAELIARMLETELRIAEHETELNLQSNLIGVLSRVLRHNLRNDLNVIRGRLQRLERQLDEFQLADLQAVEKIDGLVDLANTARRIESIAGSELDHQPVELNSLIENLFERLESEYPDAAFSIEAPDELYVEAIPSLRTALEELIENAAKHGGEAPDVTVLLEAADDSVEIHIEDDGPGLPEQEQEVLRKGAESPLIHGSGLGLWLSYWIVSNHEGSITAEVTDTGTRVTLRLPRTAGLTDFSDSETLLGQFHREQEKFEAVFEESFDAMYLFDDDGYFIDVNPATAELFGHSTNELTGRAIEEFLPEEFDFEAAWDEFKDAGRIRDTVRFVRADGTERIGEYSAVADIVPGQHLAIVRDVTQSVQQQLRYEALSTGFPDLCFIMDEDGVYRDVLTSPASDDLLYAEPETFLDRSVTDVLPEPQGSHLAETIEQTIATERAQTTYYELKTPNSKRLFEARTHPLAQDYADDQLVTMVVRDITDRPDAANVPDAVTS